MSNIKQIIEDYKEGFISLLDATLALREIRKSHEAEIEMIKAFEYDNLQEFEQYKGESYMGFEFTVVNGRKTYNFKQIPEWNGAMAEVKKIEAQAKLAFDMYQTTGQRPITEDGQLLELPEINYGKSYLKVTKSKS